MTIKTAIFLVVLLIAFGGIAYNSKRLLDFLRAREMGDRLGGTTPIM